MKRIIILLIISLGCAGAFAQSEENEEEGSVYDDATLQRSLQRTAPVIDTEVLIHQTPYFVGNLPETQGFGESQYDKDITLEELQNTSLEEARNRRRQAEQRSIMIYVIASCAIGFFIRYLFKSSQQINNNSNETFK